MDVWAGGLLNMASQAYFEFWLNLYFLPGRACVEAEKRAEKQGETGNPGVDTGGGNPWSEFPELGKARVAHPSGEWKVLDLSSFHSGSLYLPPLCLGIESRAVDCIVS